MGADSISGVLTTVSGAQQEPATVVVERGADGKKIYRIKSEFVIEGRIQKPTAFLVFNRQHMDYVWSQLEQVFLHKIEETVRGSPF